MLRRQSDNLFAVDFGDRARQDDKAAVWFSREGVD